MGAKTKVLHLYFYSVFIYTEQNYKRNTFVFAPIFHELVVSFCSVYKCDPLFEIQGKVSKFNYEITSIKVWFLPIIPL